MNSLINFSQDQGYELNLDVSEWDPRALVFGFGCNMFVADVAEAAGTKTWFEMINEPTVNRPMRTRELTAREWANRNFPIRGWELVESPKSGDVASDGHHMGIVSDDPGKIVSASSRVGMVNEVKWHTDKACLRRFRGVTAEELEREIRHIRDSVDALRKTRCF